MIRLSTGAEMRLTGPTDRAAVVCVNGGQASPAEGTWSASLEWLVSRLAPRFSTLAFSEVRYRIKSWRRLDWCEEDVRAAIAEMGAPRALLLGFSMGGAVAARSADAPGVEGVLGLAPWLPDATPLGRLQGKRLTSSTGHSIARSRACPASARRARGAASSGRARSESRAATA